MSQEGFWDSDHFEELVAKSLIAMYETKINKKAKKIHKFLRVSDKELAKIKKEGCYFSPYDRESFHGEIDIINDGFPKKAILTEGKFKKSEFLKTEYLRHCYMKRLNELPPAYKRVNPVLNPYQIIIMQATSNENLWLQKSYVNIDDEGNIYDCFIINPETGKPFNLAMGYFNLDEGFFQTDIILASNTINLYQDRRFLWNVTAQEHVAHATFGVYEEQIKSLFYARDLPLTETGRKRPILHWVESHKRRLKNGYDIDVEKYLRGINEFIYQGTKFTITRPMRNDLKET